MAGAKLTEHERFYAKCSFGKYQSCVLWTGACSKLGYGVVRKDGRMTQAHRVAWMLNVGPIPEGMHVLHMCDVRHCVRISHLFLGTHADNMEDCKAKGRFRNQKKTHCKEGHPFSVENTYTRIDGERRCRICYREAQRRFKSNRKPKTQ